MTYLDLPSEQKYKQNQNPLWDNQKIDALKKYAAQGLSASEIALKLGFATRNAVIGKMHRLNICKTTTHDQRTELRPRHRARGATIKPVPTNPQKVVQAYTHFTKKKRLRIALAVEVPDSTITDPIHFSPSEYDKAIPQEQRRTLLQLNGHTCKWGVGDVGEKDFFFCGAWTEKVYCTHHAMRAYRS
jgi:GcrA cell cycle regulator